MFNKNNFEKLILKLLLKPKSFYLIDMDIYYNS